jgi:hypothetical protein
MRAYIEGHSVYIDGVEVYYVAFPSIPLNELQKECLAEALESAVEVAARFDADRRDDATPDTLIKAFQRTLSVNFKTRRENENHCS